MRILQIEIQNFRGIREMTWAPGPGVNCLIGPGDSTKTTILDALELCLNPRVSFVADDCDFHNLKVDKPVRIVVTLGDLPADFLAEQRYGLHLRGWDASARMLEDEPKEGLLHALSVAVEIDKSLDVRWSIYNDRIAKNEDKDPPVVRYKDAKKLATNRLGPFAERHLGWGRTSVLSRLGDIDDGLSLQLAEAARAARAAFKSTPQSVFQKSVDRAAVLSKKFSVPVRGTYTAELDVQGVSITSGGVALHDDSLPLRRLGCGSARLIVAAFQHDSGPPHVALIDEIEHGLEPHRLARLLKYLKQPKEGTPIRPQIFITSHSPVVIRELAAAELYAVRGVGGVTSVREVAHGANDPSAVQAHMRATPEAFLARRIVVGEGRTEEGLVRGLDCWWTSQGRDSLAVQGVVVVSGNGKDSAPRLAAHLCDLGYGVLLLLDSDKPPDAALLQAAKDKGATVHQWPGNTSTEQRMLLDLKWDTVRTLVRDSRNEAVTEQSAVDTLNNHLAKSNLPQVTDLSLPDALDSEPFRKALGAAAADKAWFKTIDAGERVAAVVGATLDTIASTPFAEGIGRVRSWIDG
jgi:hypothetical protein